MAASVTERKVVFSGMQPTQGLMLGNYLGALTHWVKLQEEYDCIYCVVNQHAITVRQDRDALVERSYELLASYLAAGIDPKTSTFFLQSHVPQHTQLAWILECNAYMGELSRMTQFKDKSAKQKNIGVGLFTYPVLMAADILLYRTNLVPVGHDQKQHLELARDLAIRMNSTYGKDLLTVPEPYIPPVGARIMSLQDPTKKMSKSDPDPSATVFLMDDADTVVKKFKRAVTDSGTEVTYSDDKPGVKNLLTIQAAIQGKSPQDIADTYVGKQYGHLKLETAEVVNSALQPFRKEILNRLGDRTELDRILREGAVKARKKAQTNLSAVEAAIGFLRSPE